MHAVDDKDFRLPTTIRPTRYAFVLKLDVEGKRFSGAGTIELDLSEPATQVALHAIDLDLQSAQARSASRVSPATVTRQPVSQTLLLQFPEPLLAGPIQLDLAWQGAFSPGLRGLYQAG